MSSAELVTAPVGTQRCSICQGLIATADKSHACTSCAARYHEECWQENGGCGVYGCDQVPVVDKRGDLEMPAAFWGKETKACPSCAKEIVAAAVRCRHCGAVFSTQAPQSAQEYSTLKQSQSRIPSIQRRTWLVFVGCAFPLTALPVGALAAFWYYREGETVARLPSMTRAVFQVALAMASVQAIILFVVLVYTVIR